MFLECLELGRYFYYGYGRYSAALPFIAIIFGAGLAINCVKGLASREGMFDEGSTNYMTLMQWIGIILGTGAAVWGLYSVARLLLHAF